MAEIIDIKKAVSVAMEFANMLYGGKLPADFILEEIELDPQEKYWLVTVGFFLPEKPDTSFSILTQQTKKPIRAYKLIKVDANTGQPISMKIREV